MNHDESKDDFLADAVGDSPVSERRRFLVVAAKFSAVMAAVGLGGKAVLGEPAPAAGAETMSFNLIQQAIQTGDMEGAIRSYKTEVNLQEFHFKALRSLTSQDLGDLRRIQGKLEAGGGKFGLIWKKI
ncbi:MAG: hypothetical protein NTZ26_09865 [Candidatus Aminicenantes bacterium]|nr:hypothetical protein [Candidatus Aminicenantes bacterium]